MDSNTDFRLHRAPATAKEYKDNILFKLMLATRQISTGFYDSANLTIQDARALVVAALPSLVGGGSAENPLSWIDFLSSQRKNELENLAYQPEKVADSVSTADLIAMLRTIDEQQKEVAKERKTSYSRERLDKARIEKLEDEIYRQGQQIRQLNDAARAASTHRSSQAPAPLSAVELLEESHRWASQTQKPHAFDAYKEGFQNGYSRASAAPIESGVVPDNWISVSERLPEAMSDEWLGLEGEDDEVKAANRQSETVLACYTQDVPGGESYPATDKARYFPEFGGGTWFIDGTGYRVKPHLWQPMPKGRPAAPSAPSSKKGTQQAGDNQKGGPQQ